MNNLDIIKKKYKKYINNPKYVYKKCVDAVSKCPYNRKWLVIMKKLIDTNTNETRSDVRDKKYAKFRADKLKVVKIINANDPKLVKKYIVNAHNSVKTLYKVNHVVHADCYDEADNNVCSNGIHYFNSIEPAYFYNFYGGDVSEKHVGYVCLWNDDGLKKCEGYWSNCLESGEWTIWMRGGDIWMKGEYLDGKKNGIWTKWYLGVIVEQCEYRREEKVKTECEPSMNVEV